MTESEHTDAELVESLAAMAIDQGALLAAEVGQMARIVREMRARDAARADPLIAALLAAVEIKPPDTETSAESKAWDDAQADEEPSHGYWEAGDHG